MEDVDHQHKRLIEIINQLEALQVSEAAPKDLINVYAKLKNYTLYHFSHEESLLDSWPVDEVEKQAHIKAHEEFIKRLSRIDQLIDHYPVHVIDHLLAFLVKWLLHHIGVVDHRMGLEIQALQTGQEISSTSSEEPEPDALSDLYDDISIRSLDVLELNLQLQNEIELRKQAEEEAQLASLVFKNSSEAMIITDGENKIIAINPAFSRQTGYQPDEAIGEDPGILSSGRQDEAFYKEMWDTLTETGQWDGELWNRHKDGRVYAETLKINTIYRPDGSIDRRVAVFSDITEKKLAEEKIARQSRELQEMVMETAQLNILLSKEIAVKNRLFSIIAHDLRSPFTMLSGLTKRLAEKADTYSKDVLITKTQTINRAANSIYMVVENLLDWSRAQLDGEKKDIQVVEIREIAEPVLETLRPLAETKSITLLNEVGEEIALADKDMLTLILRNLVSNALKFSDPGDAIRVSAHTNSDVTRIKVSDQGTGIPEKIIKDLFAVDQKTTTVGTAGEKGTGLGLPLCADLARKQSGSIRVESTPGKGSDFYIHLPSGTGTT